jgi:hypothetical protein
MSFNWGYATKRRSKEDMAQIALFEPWQTLRRGSLYKCRRCQALWHLDGQAERMTHVDSSRLDLVLAWNADPISLPEHLVSAVEDIGPTPPDVYGNGSERRVTPCAVQTTTGETVEHAMICVQPDAPVENWMRFRLGSEIANINPSKDTLPLEVRRASSRAHEMRMGFSPSLIEMPDGRRFVLNGMTSFMVTDGYDARSATSVEGSYFSEDPPPAFVEKPHDIIYFIVDGEPGRISAEAEPTDVLVTTPKRRSWLSKIFGK